MTDVTIRGLQESGQRSGYPLVKFTGVLDSFYDEEDNFSNTQIHLQFTDLDVEEAAEPYPFPIAELTIKYSNYKNSGWGIFSQSLAKCIADDEDLADIVGRPLTLGYTPGHDLGFKDNNWQPEVDDNGNAINESERPNVVIDAWEVLGVDGVSAATGTVEDVLAGLLDGKTRAEFNRAAMTDPTVKAQGAAFIKKQITSKAFITEALNSGAFEEDGDGVFHAVA
jgi:hypothetical protein